MRRKTTCIQIALIICCACVLHVSAFAQMTMVDIPDKHVSIAVPENYIAFSGDDTDVDPRLASLGVPVSDWSEYMRQNEICLYIIHPEFMYDINVIVSDSSGVASLSLFTDDMLMSLAEVYKEEYKKIGGIIDNCDIRRLEDKTFIRLWCSMKQNTEQYVLQYITVIDSQTIVFTFADYTSPVSDSETIFLEQIITSSVLEKNEGTGIVTTAVYEERPNTNYYHDPEFGIHFMIPNGWKQGTISAGRETLKMKMIPIDDDSGTSIMYGCNDIWAQLPASSRAEMGLTSRSDIDLMFDAGFVGEIYDVAEQDVTFNNYAGMKFGVCWTHQDTSYGIGITSLSAITIKNGYMVIFQLFDMKNQYRDILDKVLNSIYFD